MGSVLPPQTPPLGQGLTSVQVALVPACARQSAWPQSSPTVQGASSVWKLTRQVPEEMTPLAGEPSEQRSTVRSQAKPLAHCVSSVHWPASHWSRQLAVPAASAAAVG